MGERVKIEAQMGIFQYKKYYLWKEAETNSTQLNGKNKTGHRTRNNTDINNTRHLPHLLVQMLYK